MEINPIDLWWKNNHQQNNNFNNPLNNHGKQWQQTIQRTTYCRKKITEQIQVKASITAFTLISITASAIASEEREAQDMSDPLAVYTQAGIGITNYGINVKFGQAYDTGNEKTLGMNILELKGIGGEALGLDSDNSIDQLRFRNFNVNTTTGRGAQLDVNLNFDTNVGTISYSLIQALPKWHGFQAYPLLGAGIVVSNGKLTKQGAVGGNDTGYEIPGSFAIAGVYTKYEINEKIWINYNPMYMHGLSGVDIVKNESILTHEVSAGYQMNKRQNFRFFTNWDNAGSLKNHAVYRLEFNHQF